MTIWIDPPAWPAHGWLLILAIGASRTYLGVHWLSDVVAGFIVGAFFLRGAEWLLARQHRRRPCAAVHLQRAA